MTLIRRIVSFLLLAIIFAGAIYGLFWLRAKKLKQLDPLKALPGDEVMFLETRNFSQLTSSIKNHNNFWNDFLVYPGIELINEQLGIIDSLGRSYEDIRMLLGGEIILSLNKADSGYNSLIIVNAGRGKAIEQILKLIPPDSEIDKHREGSATVYHVVMNNNRLKTISFYENYGLFVISRSAGLVDASARNLTSENHVDTNKQFMRLKATTGSDVVANLYVNYPGLGSFLKTIFKDDTAGFISDLAGWSAFDIDIKPDFITLNGFTTAGDSLHQAIRMFHGQDPVSFDFTSVIPSSAVYFSMTGFTDAALLMKNTGKYASDQQRDKKLELIREAGGKDLLTAFQNAAGGEAGSVILRSGQEAYTKFFLVKVKGTDMVQKIMDEWTIQAAREKNRKPGDYKSVINIDDNHPADIHQSPFRGMPGLFFGNFYRGGDYDYYTYTGNYLVFGPSPGALKTFLYLNLLGKTLENDENYKSLSDNISSRSNLFIYVDPSRFLPDMEKLLVPQVRKIVDSHREKWKKIDAIAFQGTSTDDLSYFRIFTHFTSRIREQVNTVWESKLDTVSLFKPAIVINHNNNQKEIFVQDLRNNIYLISNAGSILWKQKIDGKILSNIFQVDYYGNGKLQYLFNTGKRIYLVDRNGNPVERYPVDLRSTASAGMSLFDYDHDGTIRICVPASDKKIYMYDREGKIIPGWNFRGSEYPVTSPVKHTRIGDKDYIIACDKVKLYILDRRGRQRVSPARDILHSEENPVYPVGASGGQPPRILATDTTGTVWAFYYNGRVAKLFSPKLSSHHAFVPEDLDGDGQYEYIFTDGNLLRVYDNQGRIRFREDYPDQIAWPPVIYEFSAADKKIGIVTSRTGRIYLVNNDGSLYQGFPLLGISPFSISSFPGLKDRFNLIVGNNDNFLYNYSVK